MNRKREEHIVRVALMQTGVKITDGVNKAISESLKKIRREKYFEQSANKLLRKGLAAIDKAAVAMGMSREELVLFYQDVCPSYGYKLNRFIQKQEGRPSCRKR